MLKSDQPVLAEGCVCHADGAKAYEGLLEQPKVLHETEA